MQIIISTILPSQYYTKQFKYPVSNVTPTEVGRCHCFETLYQMPIQPRLGGVNTKKVSCSKKVDLHIWMEKNHMLI